MTAYHALLTQIVIDSTNKWLDIDTGAGGDESVSITEGTYSDILTVLAAFQVALRALGGDVASITVSLYHYSVTTLGRVKFLNGVTDLQIKWKTGAHGSDNLDTHAGHVLGFTDTADSATSFSITSPTQHQRGWYAPHGPAYDSQDMPVVLGPAPVVAASGLVRRITNPNTLDDRVMRWEAIQAAKWHTDNSASENEAFVTWWRQAARGTAFGYYTDIENETLAGRFALITPVDRLSASMAREGPGLAYFSVDMTWAKDPT